MMFKYFSMAALGFCSLCFANHHALESEILTSDPTWIREQHGEKLYLFSEQVYPTDQGIFLQLRNDQLVEIPKLHSDSNGCYILARSIKVTKPCPHCGAECISGAIKCRNSDCESNKK